MGRRREHDQVIYDGSGVKPWGIGILQPMGKPGYADGDPYSAQGEFRTTSHGAAAHGTELPVTIWLG